MMRIINRTVWILSWVSLCADLASEMLYPIVPVYLQQIGFSVFLIGILEGVAEFTAGLSKGYFGKWSDVKGVRIPFIKSGYGLSAISKPMMAMFTWPLWIFLARTIDRLGKGLRTAARDALLSQNATPQTKSRVFAFHKSMDTTGAVIGPGVALLFLYLYPQQYPLLFYLAFIPGLLSVALVFFLKETKKPVAPGAKRPSFFSFLTYWRTSSPAYKKLVTGLLLFALFNSSDVFLLLKTKQVTGSDTYTIIAYIFYNLVYAMASYPMGIWADKVGVRTVYMSGLLLFAAVYLLFGSSHTTPVLFIAFMLYGIYAAATEGIAKAWLTHTASAKEVATAIGFYTSGQSIAGLLASAIAGFLWSAFNSSATFYTTAAVSLLVFAYFKLRVRRPVFNMEA